jgi:hypothetical protein
MPIVGPAAHNPLPETQGRGPVHPQDAWPEVVGTLGEVRGNYQNESRDHLHGGLDIRGDVGQVDQPELGRVDRPAVFAHARHDRRAVARRAPDRLQALALFRIPHLTEQHLSPPEDGGQEVVEVVGHAHRQLARRAQALVLD